MIADFPYITELDADDDDDDDDIEYSINSITRMVEKGSSKCKQNSKTQSQERRSGTINDKQTFHDKFNLLSSDSYYVPK